jgi:hypothetical protein
VPVAHARRSDVRARDDATVHRSTVHRPTASNLWNAARAFLERDRGGLTSAIPTAARGGFTGGARWMAHALRVGAERPQVSDADALSADSSAVDFGRLGLVKYGLAFAAGAGLSLAVTLGVGASGLTSTAATGFDGWTALLAAGVCTAFVLGFYAVESRLVFAFPLALEGARHPLRDSNALVARTGVAHALSTVMAIAARMVFGGPTTFTRRWATGCLAVVLWYVEVRATARANVR